MTQHTIPAQNMIDVHAAFDKFNKRAVKNGMPELTLTILEEYFEERIDGFSGRKYLQKFATIDINMPVAPYIQGWQFAAKLERISGTVFNHVYVAPEFEDALPYETMKHTEHNCDHCGLNRRRKHTFIIHNTDTDEFKQVGKSCLEDFIAIDEEGIAGTLWSYATDADALMNGDWSGGSRRAELYADATTFMAAVVASVRTRGKFIGRSMPDDTPTCDDAWVNCLFPTKEAVRNGWSFEYTNDDVDTAVKVIDWLSENREELESGPYGRFVAQGATYLLDITAIKRQGIAYAASIYKSYMVKHESEKQAEETKTYGEPKHVGTLKTRMRSVPVVCVMERTNGENWRTGATRYIYKFIITEGDYAGSILVWFTDGVKDFEEDEYYTIDFTPKKHTEYNGIPTTYVNRANIV